MLHYAQLFANYMDVNDIKYTERDERTIKVVYNGDNLDTIPIFVFFDKDGDPMVQGKCWDIANFKSNLTKGIEICNKLNAEYRWVRFYIDDDGDVVADMDVMLEDATAGKASLAMVRRMVSIIDDAYPEIAKARWA